MVETVAVNCRPIVILGAGGHGRVLLELCRLADLPVVGFLDPHPPQAAVDGVAVLGDDAALDDPAFVAAHDFAIGVGLPAGHRRILRRALARGCRLPVLAHPAAVLSPTAAIGAGTVALAAAVIGTGARIGAGCIVNTGARVDHDARLADRVHVGPGAVLTGGVRCGRDAVIGAGAVVLPAVRIGARAIVGAGATVVENVPDGATVVGPKARAIV